MAEREEKNVKQTEISNCKSKKVLQAESSSKTDALRVEYTCPGQGQEIPMSWRALNQKTREASWQLPGEAANEIVLGRP